MARVQAAYKREFDARRRGKPSPIRMSNYVFIRNVHYNWEREKLHKLWPAANGPFKVISLNSDTVVVEMGSACERISHDHVVLAPFYSLR